MAYKEPRRRVCPDCGIEFETLNPRSLRCPECALRRRKTRQAEWRRSHPEKLRESTRRYYAKHPEKKPPSRPMAESFPLQTVPCHGGCGTMVETKSRKKMALCPACRAKKKRESTRRYYAAHREELVLAQQQARAAKAALLPPKPKAERTPRPKATAASKPKPAPKPAPARRLPTEAEKLAMLRAALKRYRGE